MMASWELRWSPNASGIASGQDSHIRALDSNIHHAGRGNCVPAGLLGWLRVEVTSAAYTVLQRLSRRGWCAEGGGAPLVRGEGGVRSWGGNLDSGQGDTRTTRGHNRDDEGSGAVAHSSYRILLCVHNFITRAYNYHCIRWAPCELLNASKECWCIH